MKRIPAVAAALAGALVLGACTFVPTDPQPQAISKRDVPFELLSKTLPTTTVPSNTIYVTRSIWLIDGNRQLSARPRRVPVSSALSAQLAALFAGPTDHESALGFTSEVPATWRVTGIGYFEGIIFVRVSAPTPVTGPASALESGQIVLTTAGATNQYVEVLINNKPLDLTLPDGTTQLQVRPTDYESLLAR